MVGDFNEINGNHEKAGGRNQSENSFPYSRDCLSWVGRKHNYLIKCCLDRRWEMQNNSAFSRSTSQYLRFIGSDNRPIITHLSNCKSKAWKKFRFHKHWTFKTGVKTIVREGWIDNDFDEEMSPHDRKRSVDQPLPNGEEMRITTPKRLWRNWKAYSIESKWTSHSQQLKFRRSMTSSKNLTRKKKLFGNKK